MLFLSQAWPLGGLPRAAPVPFRASFFTPGQHLPGATAQGLIAYLYKRWRFPLIPSMRFVAHAPGATSGRVAGHTSLRPRQWPQPSLRPRPAAGDPESDVTSTAGAVLLVSSDTPTNGPRPKPRQRPRPAVPWSPGCHGCAESERP